MNNMNTKDLSGITIAKRMKLQHSQEADHNFSWDQKKVLNSQRKHVNSQEDQGDTFLEES